MIEWLAAWGVSNAVGFLFKPVMQKFAEDLGKDILKDVLKDVVKGLPGNILGRLEKDEINKAVGKAIKEFLEIFQQELLNDLEDAEVKQYNQSLKKFLGIDDVKAILGSAFHPDIEKIDTKKLEQIWYDKNLLQLPEEFDWRRLNKPYVRKVKAIIRESDKLREIFDSYKLEEIADNTKQIAGIATDFNLPRYQEALRQEYGYLTLDSLDTSGSAYNELKLRSTYIIQNVREFERVIPQVLEKTKEYQKWLRDNQEEAEFNPQELQNYRQFYKEAPTIAVTDIINNRQSRDYTIILGEPGAGKSTLLQFLALNWAESTLSNSFSQPIPILIELRTYVRQFDKDKCKNFLDFLHQAPGAICHLNQLKLNELFKAGNALVMFDGLDEIFDRAKREDIITDIIRFTNKYPNVQVIITSRVIGYKPERFRNAEFRHFMLQDFDSEQIQDFINRWHQLAFNDKNDAELKKARLNRALESSKAIQELAGNPLLLTMMAILNRHRELPRDRSTLYEKAAEVLLQQWDAETKYLEGKVSIDLTDKQAILRKVAYQMQANDQGLTGNLINVDDLHEIFQSYLENIGYQKLDARNAAKELINQLRDRNFILCHAGDNYYAFVHRTFLEYFCAEAFRRQFEKEKSLTLEQLKTEVYGKHWQDEAWDEVLKLIAGAIDAKFVGEIIEYLIGIDGEEEKFRNIFLAAGCLGEVKNRKVLEEIDIKLLPKIKQLIYYYREHDYGFYSNHFEKTPEINMEAVSAIARIWKEDCETVPMLKAIVTNSSYDDWVTSTAVLELADNFREDSEILSWLKTIAIKSAASEITASTAITAVAQYFKEYPGTLSWLKNIAINDEYDLFRGTAVAELAKHFKDDSSVLHTIKNSAINDESEAVRCQAVEALAQHIEDNPDIVSILKTCINQDEHKYVLALAMKALAQHLKYDLESFQFLSNIAINRPFNREEFRSRNPDKVGHNPRQIALEAIIKHYPNYPQTLPLLRDRAKNDPDEHLRKWAKKRIDSNRQ